MTGIMFWEPKKLVVVGAAVTVATFIIGILIGFYSSPSSSGENANMSVNQDRFKTEVVERFMSDIKTENLRENLRHLTKEPHIAASARDRHLADWIESKWLESGLEEVTRSTYDFLLSYPDPDKPNRIHLFDANNTMVWHTQYQEKVSKEDAHPNFIHAFNAYSPKGDVTGELVYVNYARVEDITELEELGVNLTGKIAIARYGKIFRGNKVTNCETAGAAGVILYSDPAQVAPFGVEAKDVYPNTMFLPLSGIQRGSVFIGDGDPSSPGYTSIEGAYRHPSNETPGLPGIPSQPIGYGDAENLLKRMGGDLVPEEWAGAIKGVTYRLGPGFNNQESKGWTVRLVVNNNLKDTKDSNVIGVIRGEVEPDRFVLVGNHRDAWGYGSVDPSSGTAVLMETVRVFGKMFKAGWRPRRTIVFASWCAEEYGLEGSTEYVYENINHLMNRAVGLVNLDICSMGPILNAKASPILKDVFLQAIQSVQTPSDESMSIQDFMVDYQKRLEKPVEKASDLVKGLGSGSDHAYFSFYAGVPALYYSFAIDRVKFKDTSGYPAYHTGFETFGLVDKIIDPDYRIHRSCSQLMSTMSLNLLESSLLPLNPTHIAEEVQKGLDALEKNNQTKLIRENGAGEAYDLMLNKFKLFNMETEKFMNSLKNVDLEQINPYRLRELNDRLMLLDRVFILPAGLPDRPEERHALFSPSKFNAYGSSSLPGISDLLHQVDKLNSQEKSARFKRLRQHLSDLMIVFHQATKWLSTNII